MKTYFPLAGCLFILLISNCGLGSNLSSEQAPDRPAKTVKQKNHTPDPCAVYNPLRDPNNEELKRKYLVSMKGYPKEVTVREAIGLFNERASCHHIGKSQPPLTEEEFLTAVRDIPREEPRPSAIEVGYLQKVSEKGILPKGSLIDFGWGIDEKPGYDITYWKIYLRFDLHTHPRVPDDLIDPKSVRHDFTIRRQYISSKKQ
jgi:hypothetical protein